MVQSSKGSGVMILILLFWRCSLLSFLANKNVSFISKIKLFRSISSSNCGSYILGIYLILFPSKASFLRKLSLLLAIGSKLASEQLLSCISSSFRKLSKLSIEVNEELSLTKSFLKFGREDFSQNSFKFSIWLSLISSSVKFCR